MATAGSTNLVHCDCGVWHNIGSAHRCAQPLGFEPEDYPVICSGSPREQVESAQAHYSQSEQVQALERENARLTAELRATYDQMLVSAMQANATRDERDRYRAALERIAGGSLDPRSRSIARAALAPVTEGQGG